MATIMLENSSHIIFKNTSPSDLDGVFKTTSFYEGTEVTFAEIDSETIRAYIKTGEPM